jgi:succinyl-CoA synthetase beta subunit
MNIHEFQAKQLFQNYGIPIPDGKQATTANSAGQIARELGGEGWVFL